MQQEGYDDDDGSFGWMALTQSGIGTPHKLHSRMNHISLPPFYLSSTFVLLFGNLLLPFVSTVIPIHIYFNPYNRERRSWKLHPWLMIEMPPRSVDNEDNNEESVLLIEEPTTKDSDDDESASKSLWSLISTEMIDYSLPIALPTVLSMVVTKIPFLITIRWVGGLGTQELAAASLATTLCNVTGASFSVGTSAALTTLAGQAKGELCSKTRDPESDISQDEPLTPVVFLFRGLIVTLSLVIPIGLWWLSGIDTALVALGQEATVASMTATYLKILCPGMWGYSTR